MNTQQIQENPTEQLTDKKIMVTTIATGLIFLTTLFGLLFICLKN